MDGKEDEEPLNLSLHLLNRNATLTALTLAFDAPHSDTSTSISSGGWGSGLTRSVTKRGRFVVKDTHPMAPRIHTSSTTDFLLAPPTPRAADLDDLDHEDQPDHQE